MYQEWDLCEDGQETPVFSRIGKLRKIDFSDSFSLGMIDSSDEVCRGRGRWVVGLRRLMRKVESKFASFCCALA